MRSGIFPFNYKYKHIDIKNCKFINFLMNENIKLKNIEGLDIYLKYKNKNSIIFMDPPYLLADNSAYKSPSLIIYEYICNNHIDNETSKIIFSTESNFMTKLLFKNYKQYVYDKQNKSGRRKHKQHLILFNATTEHQPKN